MSRVLLIESDAILADSYRRAIAAAGHRVQTADNAQQAVKKMDAELPDVIVLEPELAHHDGIELLYEVRSYSDWRNIPIIVHSLSPRYRQFCLSERGAAHGIASFLYKPHTRLQDLVYSIEQQLSPT